MKLDIGLASYEMLINSDGEVVDRNSNFKLKDLQREDWKEYMPRTYTENEIIAAMKHVYFLDSVGSKLFLDYLRQQK